MATDALALDPSLAVRALARMRATVLRRLAGRWPGLRYSVVQQYDAADCGASALLTVLRFHGGDTSFPHVRDLTFTDARGSTMLAVVNAARRLGFAAKGAAGTYDQLRAEALPAIAHIVTPERLQHFVVVFEAGADRVVIGDPASGVRTLPRGEFEALWVRGAVVLLSPTPQLHRTPAPRWTAWLAAYLGRDHVWLSQTLFLAAVQTALGLFLALFLQILVDRLIPEGRTDRIVVTGAMLLALQCGRGVLGYVRQRMLLELNRRVSVHINEEFLSRIFSVPLQFFRTRRKGDITARIQDVIRIQGALLSLCGTAIIDGTVLVGSLALLLVLAPSAAAVALVACGACAGIVLGLSQRLRRRQRDLTSQYSVVESSYIDALDGIEDIRCVDGTQAFSGTLSASFTRLQHRVQALGMTHAGIGLLAEVSAAVLIVGSLTVGAVLVARGELELGRMMAAYSLLAAIIPSTLRLADANSAVQALSVAANRLFDLIRLDPEPLGGARPFRLDRALTLEGVRFAWRGGTATLKGVDMVIRNRAITGIWGQTGAGKTTLVNLLQGRSTPDAGAICIDGHPYQAFQLSDIRRNVAVVPAAVKIFNGTLADNILVGRPIAEDELLRRTAALGFQGLVQRFAGGFMAPLGEDGRRPSSGEQQLVALFRALIDEPAVLVMDEGLNALDVALRGAVFELLDNYARDHAVVLISHDPGVLARAGTVYVLADGTVTSQMTGAELLERGYACTAQG
jgi:ATP-binding cassette subfamily B protein